MFPYLFVVVVISLNSFGDDKELICLINFVTTIQGLHRVNAQTHIYGVNEDIYQTNCQEKMRGRQLLFFVCQQPLVWVSLQEKFSPFCSNGDTKNLNQVYTADNWHRQVSNQPVCCFLPFVPNPVEVHIIDQADKLFL